MFQASYIQRTQKIEPLNPVDEKIYIKTLFSTISAGNSHFIESSLNAGVSLLVIQDGCNLLDVAREKNHPHIIESLLIQSMRRTELFPKESLNKTINYALSQKQYQLIDLLVYAIRQQLSANESFVDFINCYDYLNRLSEAAHGGLLLPIHYQQLEDLIKKPKINADALFYFYYLWEKIFKEKQDDILKLYHIIATAYQSFIQKKHQSLHHRIYYNTLGGLVAWSFLSWVSLHQPLISISGFFIIVYFCYASLNTAQSKRLLNECKLHDAARTGDYATVENMIKAETNINLIGGVAQSTPLFEAERIKNQQIIQLIKSNHGVNAQGAQAFSDFE